MFATRRVTAEIFSIVGFHTPFTSATLEFYATKIDQLIYSLQQNSDSAAFSETGRLEWVRLLWREVEVYGLLEES